MIYSDLKKKMWNRMKQLVIAVRIVYIQVNDTSQQVHQHIQAQRHPST